MYAHFRLRTLGKQPAPKKLQAWVMRRLGLKGAQAKPVAFLIGRKIARGVEGDPVVRQAIDRVAATFDQ